MKTHDILRALRASTTPAARLAAWQDKGLSTRRRILAERMAAKYSPAASLADARRDELKTTGPELSAPESETPYLWTSEESREVSDFWQGRNFLDHCGWYTMEEDFSETMETCAVRLDAFPGLVFFTVRDSMGGGDLRVNLDDWHEIDFSDAGCGYSARECLGDAAKGIIRSCDSTTAREAEERREFYRKDQAEREIEENRETLAGLRGEIRALVAELKTLCPSPIAAEYPSAGKALRLALRGLLGERSELMDKNARLAETL